MVNQIDGAGWHPEDLPPGRHAVMFTADWCGYCRRFYPHFKRLRTEFIVDISDEDLPLWDNLHIRVVPTVVVFENGKELQRWAGVLADHHVTQVEALLRSGSP